MHPYDHLPFEWSVHVLKKLGATPEHFEFLATDASDPRRGFIISLCGVLDESGSIVMYCRNSRRGCPEFSRQIRRIQTRL